VEGDLTDIPAIVGSLETMARDGEMAKILARYIGDARVTELRGLTRPE
jgi:hypothetical protein